MMKAHAFVDIRPEIPNDIPSIRAVTAAAFKNIPFSKENEADIVDALRRAGALTISFVATEQGNVVGHVAFSPVLIDREAGSWYGLGPVSVRPENQRRGVGRRLIERGLEALRSLGAEGCVVLGEPSYYGRFGFVSDPDLRLAGAPPGYFQRVALKGTLPKGEVSFQPAFGQT